MAFFITFRCYGTWLHGDKRGSTNRFQNQYGTPHLDPNDGWKNHNANLLRSEPQKLHRIQREIVRRSIEETARFRNWSLHAVNVGTNHVHVVIGTGKVPGKRGMATLKANATRALREAELWNFEHSPWSRKGSVRYLWDISSIGEAVDYVLYGQ